MTWQQTTSIPKKPEGTPAPLSLAQQRLWFIYQLNPQSPAYNISWAWRLKGSLNTAAFKTSLNQILERHEVLRTTFQEIHGQPVQIIRPALTLPLREEDWSSYSLNRFESEIQRILIDEPLKSFSLTTGPLLRFSLIRNGLDDHVFIFTIHHLVFDGTSLKNFCQELSQGYQATVSAQPIPFAFLPITYKDFAYWQQEHFQEEILAPQISYWKKQLHGAPLVLEVPSDYPRPKDSSGMGNVQTFAISSPVISQLKSLIQPQGITLFMALLTVFQVLLVRYTNQRDILIGVPIAGRMHSDLDPLMGCFINTLALRMKLNGLATFREVLKQASTTCLNSYHHSDLPFEKIVELLHPVRDPSRHPVVQTFFQLNQASDLQLHLPELEAYPFPVKKRTGDFDLHMVCEETPSGIQGYLYYSQNHFPNSMMARFANHYQILVEKLLTHPDRPVSQVCFLPETETQQVLIDWNDTAATYPLEKSLSEFFEIQVYERPDAMAVVCGEEQLTYAQLNQRVNQLAHYLQRHGVGLETRVGICLERGINLIVSLLAVLKAGAAYVPLDPMYPQDRLNFMSRDVGMSVLISDGLSIEKGRKSHCQTINLQKEWSKISRESGWNPEKYIKPDNIAYVIYTSGSTGTPKGVQITHKAVGNLIFSMQRVLRLGLQDKWMAVTSISFDIAVLEIFLPLCQGVQVILARRETTQDVVQLARTIDESDTTIMQATPTTWQLLMTYGWHPLHQMTFLCGGESLTPNLADQMRTRTSNLWNVYGPTETTVWSTIASMNDHQGTVLIGRPLSNTRTYVMDRHRNLAPMGVHGELYLGGKGIARGYHNRPDLTAEKFLPDSANGESGGRVYRTGDLVRYRENGTLEFLGRLDQQVKLRGFRIELGEIESVLGRHPAVREVVVECREDVPGQKELVAYIVPIFESSISVKKLRTYLQGSLPDYMIPTAFVVLDAIPLTPNGKADRRALPIPETDRDNLVNGYVAPRNPIEEVLTPIWEDLLHHDVVGVHDSFFDLGGHSLLATQVISRVRETFQLELPLRLFFERPTIADLAQTIEEIRGIGEPRRALPLVAHLRQDPLPLSFAQQRLWFLQQIDLQSPAYNMSLTFCLEGSPNVEALQTSLQNLVDRHETLRTTFSEEDGQPFQIIAKTMKLPLHQHDFRASQPLDRESMARDLVQDEAFRPFNLVTGPLIRSTLIQLEEIKYVLVIAMHHIISDGWSMGVFVHELSALYEGYVTNTPSSLMPLSVQYVDYGVWQRAWLQGEVLEGQLGYWVEQLAEVTPLALPTDYPRPLVQSYAGASHVVWFDSEVTKGLHKLSRGEQSTLAITLLAAFNVLLAKYTGQTDLVVGMPIANRNIQEIESLIGFFVNSLVMRTNLAGDPTFQQILRRVHDMALSAYDHQDLPFERLVEELQPQRDLSRNPLFQVMFAVQNAPFGEFSLTQLKVNSFQTQKSTTRFDLECHVFEESTGLKIMLVYNTDLFKAATIERLGRHFQRMLEVVVWDPPQPLSMIELLDVTERQQQLVEWNATTTAYPRERTIAELFEVQVAKTPEAIALVFADQQLTYAQLDHRATQLAHYLRRQGVGPDVCVGLCLKRSVEMVVGVLGILKAGGAYMPMDPKGPPKRGRFMLEDAGCAFLVTQEALRYTGPAVEWTGPVVALDTEWEKITKMPTLPVTSEATVEHLAYVIYTSGSTGDPKGITIPQRAVVRLVMETNFLLTGPDEIFLQLAPLAFDASTFEVWGSLLHGAKLVLYPSDQPSFEELGEVLREECITTLWLTAALFQQMVDQQLEALCGVRQLLAGGDVLPVPQVHRLLEHLLPGHCLINGYGPTENTTFTCCHRMTRGSQVEKSVPIGVPISNTQAYVVDRHQHLVPVGVYGELYVGGDGLARGYLKQPGLTAAHFMPHPWSPKPGARLYRTGDLVRFLPEGDLEFQGRRDTQVKVRGYRIELGEIQAVLMQQATVAAAVAVVRDDASGNSQLVAYVVPDSEQAFEQITKEDQMIWEAEHISTWQTLYEDIYKGGGSLVDPTFNITGWNSSYTGQPIPAEEMQEWVDATVERIQSLQPERILEIGCGTGLLLYRLAPASKVYVGTDFSGLALEALKQGLAGREEFTHVQLTERTAEDMHGFAPASFDTVIINSVTQYFPSMDYLAHVLEEATALIQPGGHMVVGDVRSLPLLSAYHASVQLYQAERDELTNVLAQRIQQAQAREEELVIDPAFFTALRQSVPRIGAVEILWKRGQAQNELTRFRYDVILHVSPSETKEEDIRWIDWAKEGLSLTRLPEWLEGQTDAVIGFTGIPNARIHPEKQLLDWVEHQTGPTTLRELREALKIGREEAVDPQSWWETFKSLPFWCEVGERGCDARGTMTAVLRQRKAGRRPCVLPWQGSPVVATETGWGQYGTKPLKAKLVKTLIPSLRTNLASHFPEYMVPNTFVTLEELPLTANGKVNHRALPSPEGTRAQLATTFVAPRTSLEQKLVAIWQEVLGLEQVGIHDNFFELGGHSLLATSIISKVRFALSTNLSLKELLQYPTVAEIANQIQSLENTNEDDQDSSRIPIIVRPKTLPLSYAQVRFWFLDQFQDHPEAFNHLRAYRLIGLLNTTALQQSFQELVNRHESFRTSFIKVEGRPQQVISPHVLVEFPITHMGGLPESERAFETEKIMREENRPYDLTRGPLMRVRLLRFGDQEHILIFNTHHIIIDAWSMEVIHKEISILYNSLCEGRVPSLEPLKLQYPDFAVWQRERIDREVGEQQLAYWTEQLAETPIALPLPTDYLRGSSQSFQGGWINKTFSQELCEKLQEFKIDEASTTFMVLLGGLQLLLHRFSGMTDISIGAPVSGRIREELNPLIGCFLNNLVLRTDLSGSLTFRMLIQRVREVVLEAFHHQEIPFEKLLEHLHPIRKPGYTPFFQVLLNMHNFADKEIALSGLTTQQMRVPHAPSLFDWTLYFQEHTDNISVTLVYNVSLFREARMSELLSQLEELLEQGVTNPDRAIEQYSLVTQGSCRILPDPAHVLPVSESCGMLNMFSRHVAQRPDRPAVIDTHGTWSYQELDARSNQVAHYLRTKGIFSQEVVAVYAHREASFVCAVLGVLKAGAVVLILDPAYPDGRLERMLQLAQPKGLINLETAGPLPACLETYAATIGCHCRLAPPTASSSEGSDSLHNYPTYVPAVEIQPDDLAYLLFTSGTTGMPQGVQITHRPLGHFLEWYTQEFALTSTDRFTLFSGLSHDPVFRDILTPLWVGGTLCIPDPDDHALGQVGSWMQANGITVSHLTPAYLDLLSMATKSSGGICPSLRLVVSGGDHLRPDHVSYLRRLAPQACWVNSYGTSETPQIMSYFVVPAKETSWSGSLPVGHGIEGVQLLVLNQIDQLAGIGELGEICIRTPYLAIEYLQNASLSRAKFQPNPFGRNQGDRWFRTGDLGRYRPDGTVEVVGRNDRQVKLRGYRIELGEIETVLRRQTGLREAIVLCRKNAQGDKHLVAYVVAVEPEQFTSSKLRAMLSTQLPDYMMPGTFVMLEALPLTPNGKVDWRALPVPELADRTQRVTYVAPCTVLEELLVEVWEGVLKVENIGTQDNFFELGGHSLLAIQVIARLRNVLNQTIPLRSLFEHPNIAQFAQTIDAQLFMTDPE
jgi:amino acid adenylation domain-containing protein